MTTPEKEDDERVILRELALDDYNKYYSHTAICDNCGETNVCYIPKGLAIWALRETIECVNCGCVIVPTPFRK